MRRAVGKTENERTHLRMRGEQAPQRHAGGLAVELGEPVVETFLRRPRAPASCGAVAIRAASMRSPDLIRRRCKCRHPAS